MYCEFLNIVTSLLMGHIRSSKTVPAKPLRILNKARLFLTNELIVKCCLSKLAPLFKIILVREKWDKISVSTIENASFILLLYFISHLFHQAKCLRSNDLFCEYELTKMAALK